ncbi:hypothetical protein EZS27_007998 [termite gut metagenome]|uniref:Uncharacterized protein n=1 Tax=termite gut metagenome TaxID=433724 RepID=A0A5J4SDZ4_9ZZZZ
MKKEGTEKISILNSKKSSKNIGKTPGFYCFLYFYASNQSPYNVSTITKVPDEHIIKFI